MAKHHRLPHVAPPASLRWAFGQEATLLDLCQHRILPVEFELHKLTHSGVNILDSIESGRDEFGARRSLWVVHESNNGLGGAARAIVALLVETHVERPHQDRFSRCADRRRRLRAAGLSASGAGRRAVLLLLCCSPSGTSAAPASQLACT